MVELVDMLRKTWGTRRAHKIDFWVSHDPRKGGCGMPNLEKTSHFVWKIRNSSDERAGVKR